MGFAGPSYRRARGGSRGQFFFVGTSTTEGPSSRLYSSGLTYLVPSFRMGSSATGTVVQNERKVRLVDSRIELSARRSQHAAQSPRCRRVSSARGVRRKRE